MCQIMSEPDDRCRFVTTSSFQECREGPAACKMLTKSGAEQNMPWVA